MIFFNLLLCIIAGSVAYGLSKKEDVWPVICLYWFILTIKYIVEIWLR